MNTIFDRNDRDESNLVACDNIMIEGHEFDCLGNALNHEAHALMHRVLPFCNTVELKGAMIEHAGHRWWFDSDAMLNKVEVSGIESTKRRYYFDLPYDDCSQPYEIKSDPK